MAPDKHTRLADELRRNIFSGMYGPQGGIPTAQELATTYGVALNTAGKALTYLAGEGLIVKRGQNYYVNHINITMTQYSPPSHMRYANGYTDNLQPMGFQPLPDHLVARLLISPVTVMYRGQVSGEIEGGVPIPLQIARRYYFLSLTDEQILKMITDPTYDPMWVNAPVNLVSYDEVAPRPATLEELTLLNLSNTPSVTDLWEVIYDMSGNILMAQEITLSPRIRLNFKFPFENKASAE